MQVPQHLSPRPVPCPLLSPQEQQHSPVKPKTLEVNLSIPLPLCITVGFSFHSKLPSLGLRKDEMRSDIYAESLTAKEILNEFMSLLFLFFPRQMLPLYQL